MPYRSPARFLAPVALIAAVVTIYVVAKPQLDSVRSDAPAPTTSTSSTTTPAKKTSKKKAKTYTVKPGDSLGTVAEKTGVSQGDLLDYNDIADPSSLSVGQKLKLTAP